jgi:glycosyltransferase involved in cell wall biosynthesis
MKNILIALRTFRFLTGAEVHCYELGKELVNRGYKVVVTAGSIGGTITEKAKEVGMEVYDLNEPILDFIPDIMHLNEYIPSKMMLERYRNIPAVATIHSEFEFEKPYVSNSIKKYICIRPSIQEKLQKSYGIRKDKTVMIYNGFDLERFNHDNVTEPESATGLFVGTVDAIRKKSILHFTDMCRNDGIIGKVIGFNPVSADGIKSDYLDGYKDWIQPDPKIGGIWDIEKYVKDCSFTAGILMGRTTIEGWLCGKPGLIYDVDRLGEINKVTMYVPPKDLSVFGIKYMCSRVLDVYKEAMCGA